MVTNAQVIEKASPVGGAGWWARLMGHRDFVAFWFMLPAATILLVFLAYPLFLGIWLSMTDTTIGRPGIFIGLENFAWLWADRVFWLSVFNTFLYTVVASILNFSIVLVLALLLKRTLPFHPFFCPLLLFPLISMKNVVL